MGATESHQEPEQEQIRILCTPGTLKENLLKLAENLTPSPEVYKTGRVAVNEIVEVLKESRRDVVRSVIVGSFGKKTAIITDKIAGAKKTDQLSVDLVVYINDEEPPFGQVLEQFEHVLRKEPSLGVTILNSIDQYFLKIQYKDLILNIIPATKFEATTKKPGSRCCRESEDGSTQESVTLERISVASNLLAANKKYESGLAEAKTNYIKSKNAFTHSVIRLAKFWNHHINFEGRFVNSQSYLIEIVATLAANQSQGDIVKALETFFRHMSNFSSLQLILGNVTKLPRDIKNAAAVVLDPINPYNNLAIQYPFVIKRFEEAAGSTLKRLRAFKQGKGHQELSSVSDLLIPVESFTEISYDEMHEFVEDCFDFRPESDVIRL